MSSSTTSSLADPSVLETQLGDEGGGAQTLGAEPRGDAGPTLGEALQRGAMLGRYIVLDRLGRGGMGIVYAAYDPELDRKVALKVLLPGRDRSGSARIRLQREAQAIARLSHPNVVAVHDVGTVGEQVFIAMELVEGMDLARWLAAGSRTLTEIVELFLQAGAGLAAAHAAELVHRDFKPENVLVGRDGRARVVDFGLVRKAETASLSESSPVADRGASPHDELHLTDAGAPMGTPAYMSPEQFSGLVGDARSDQFSFCVALFEALYGERPFAGETAAALAYSVIRGELRAPASTRAVPGRLRQALLRGLAVEPQARHASMEALMAAIRRATAPRRHGWWWAGLGATVVAGGGIWVAVAQEQACAHASDRAAIVWSPERQAALQQRFEATGRTYAADTWQRVRAYVDGHVAEWSALQHGVCEANRGLAPAVTAEDPRQRCLDERIDELDDLLAIFGQAEAHTVTQAVPLVHGLGALADCRDVDGKPMAPSPSDPALREQVTALRAELRRMELASKAGVAAHDPQALAALVERAEGLGYAPLLAEIYDVQSDLAEGQGDYDRAAELGELAFEAALASRHDLLAFRVAATLTFLYGSTRREPAEALRWGRRAEAMRVRMGDDSRLRMQLSSHLANVYALAGDEPRARELYEESLALLRELDDPVNLATALNNIGAFHAERRRLDEAYPYLEEATAKQAELLGPNHPSTLRSRSNLGITSVMAGRVAEGRALLEAVLPLQEAALGRDHPEVGFTLEGLASALVRQGELTAAEAMRRRVVEIRERSHAPGSQPLMAAKNNLAVVLIEAKRFDEAHALLIAMLRELDAAKDAMPRVRMLVTSNLAMVSLRRGQPQEALPYAETSLTLCRATSCTAADELEVLERVSRAKLGLGDLVGAREVLMDAPSTEGAAANPGPLIQVRFDLARATLAEDREAALALARQALAEAKGSDPRSRELARDIAAWLREHGDSG